jgi:secreted trypsin-like serine protease
MLGPTILAASISIGAGGLVPPVPSGPPDLTPFAIIRGDRIIDGDRTAGRKPVGAILLNGSIHCTGTLVSRLTVLTAAHCVEGLSKQINERRYSFALGSDSAHPEQIFQIVAGVYPRGEGGLKYSPINYAHDVGLLYLETAPDLQPAPLHSGSPDWTKLQQDAITFVGYGYDRSSAGRLINPGIKREGRWQVSLSGKQELGWAGTTQSTCFFDSGGPGLNGAPSPVVVAIISNGDRSCTRGRGMRVDAYGDWIRERMR